MSSSKNLRKSVARKGASTAILMLVAALTACGGSGNDEASRSANAAATPPDSSTTPASDLPSANANFFDSIFLDASGAGYYEFGANYAKGFYPTATGRTRLYVTGDTDTNFSLSSTDIFGPYAANSEDGYLTAEGAFMSINARPSDIGDNSRIFQRLPQGYQLGVNGMSGPLYEITLTVNDVAEEAVNSVVARDEAGGNGLTLLLGNDTTAMPAGAQTYRQIAKTLVSHVAFSAFISNQGFTSLEQAQARNGGVIQTLGGYRYLSYSKHGALVEYNGTIYGGQKYDAGDVNDAKPSGYNRIAADFLAQEQQKIGLPH
ncbi:hypothetical protein AWB64_04378 [Caballeronia sordidicola]|uniref:Lipoprotein n=1 Tax=Caballeronia sordidicola TaxID=196367 RepID=A0A158HA42_CABSO|nr:hypothetical protein [Caballeronia sordidicola]SAL41166.1 hypothetical protein AWB64_04378 [Caballeronia sordidicola]